MSERSCSGPHILHLYLESWYWRSGSTWGMPRGVVRIYSVDFTADAGAFLGVGSGSTNTTNSLATCFSALLHLFLLSLYPRPPYPIWTMSKKNLLFTIKDVSKDITLERAQAAASTQINHHPPSESCVSIKNGSLKHVCPSFHAFGTPFRTTTWNCPSCGFVTIADCRTVSTRHESLSILLHVAKKTPALWENFASKLTETVNPASFKVNRTSCEQMVASTLCSFKKFILLCRVLQTFLSPPTKLNYRWSRILYTYLSSISVAVRWIYSTLARRGDCIKPTYVFWSSWNVQAYTLHRVHKSPIYAYIDYSNEFVLESALARIERSTFSDHNGTRTVVFVALSQDKHTCAVCHSPHYDVDIHVCCPKEGDLCRITAHGVRSVWSIDKPSIMQRGLRLLWTWVSSTMLHLKFCSVKPIFLYRWLYVLLIDGVGIVNACVAGLIVTFLFS